MDIVQEKEKLITFFHHLPQANICDVVMIFDNQGYADEYIAKTRHLELTNIKFQDPSKEKVVKYVSTEIKSYIGDEDSKLLGAHNEKYANVFFEFFGGNFKILNRIRRAFRIGKVGTLEGYADVISEKQGKKYDEKTLQEIKAKKDHNLFLFDISIF